MAFEDILEILHKPNPQEVRTDLDSWAGTLAHITTGTGKLQFDAPEAEIYRKWCAYYLGKKIAGGLSPRHRDRGTLDNVSAQINTEIDKEVNRLGWDKSPTRKPKLAFIQRAADLVSATYMNTKNDPESYGKIQNTVNTLLKTNS